MRLFLAIDLPDTVRKILARTVDTVRADRSLDLPPVRWVRLEGAHLTLAFLGEVEEERVHEIDAALAPVSARHPAMEACLGVHGVFPARGKARVLWRGLDVDGDLPSLHREVESALAALPDLYEPAGRPFRPHVTLGRCRRPWPRPAVARWRAAMESADDGEEDSAGTFRIDELVLFRSELLSGGPQYSRLRRWPLAG